MVAALAAPARAEEAKPAAPPQKNSQQQQQDLDVDALLRALQMAADNPDLLQKALKKQIDSVNESTASMERELKALHEKVESLNKVGALLERLGGKPAPAASPAAPVKAADVVPAKPTQAEAVAPAPPAPAPTAATGDGVKHAPGLTEETKLAFADRFKTQLWPLITAGEKNCFGCHGNQTQTPLEMSEDSRETFLTLLQKNYFDPENPSSLLAKLSSPTEKNRMPPPPATAWDEAKLKIIRAFVNDLFKARGGEDLHADENFPDALLQPFDKKTAEAQGQDNVFLSYYQLKRKVQEIFADDWKRNERDLFGENIVMFSGADFQVRFNESSKPTAEFLAGLDLMATDVASKAYLSGGGPFAGLKVDLSPPVFMSKPDAAYSKVIAALYRRILFRDPTPAELATSFDFIRKVYQNYKPSQEGGAKLAFDVTVTGEEGPPTVRSLVIDLNHKPHGLYQEFINESSSPTGFVARHKIGDSFAFKAGDASQCFVLTNRDTVGAVGFYGLEVVGPLPARVVRTIEVGSSAIKLSGPWRGRGKRQPLPTLDDADENKGECKIEIPIKVTKDGEYEVYLKWARPPKRNLTSQVVAEVYSYGPTHLVSVPLPERPPKGEAHFRIDQTMDTIAFWDLKTSFRFDTPDEYLQIGNEGTTKRVTADAVKFVRAGRDDFFLIDNDRADGKKDWPTFTDYPFRPYNITGEDTVSDKNARKGELKLRYKPAAEKEWKKGEFYDVQVGFPGQVDNETRTPVVVKAAASSPIVRLLYPPELPLGGTAVLDASASYDVQGSKLKFQWKQVGGPKVEISDATAPNPMIETHPVRAEQAAWEGLVRALIRHPDFTFTRPVSLARAMKTDAAKRLQFVKVAQDLVARPPTPAEMAKFESGTSLGELVDGYLASQEFRDFYFRRIRLYLESHGSEEEDEATRLWCYVAFNDRPFKEILTADYSINPKMERVNRPDYYGHTGILTMKGFIDGKPGLPHFNYAAQVAEKFLGYVFEVPPEIVAQREGITAAATTSPGSVCYSCHKVLTPLAYQRQHWDDKGAFRIHDTRGLQIDASDQGLVATYPFKGSGMEAFALAAQNKERFIRTIINTHFTFFFGREMRWETDERGLYHRLWDSVHKQNFSIRALIKDIVMSPEYLGGGKPAAPSAREVAESASP